MQENTIIENLLRKLIHGEIHSVEYLESICYQYKTNLEDIVNEHEIDRVLDAEDLYESTSEAKDVVSQRVCIVSLVREPDTLIIPCRYAQICYSCTETIANSDVHNKRPVCRVQIDQFLQIYL